MLLPRLTPRGFEVSLTGLRIRMGRKNVDKLLKQFVFREKPQPGAPAASLRNLRVVTCYIIDDDTLILPRRFAHNLVIVPNLFTPAELAVFGDARGMFGGQPHGIRRLDPTRSTFAGSLYPYQEHYVDYVCEQRLGPDQRSKGCAQVYMYVPTGRGKTAMAMAVIGRLMVPALVIVPTRALQADGVAEANKFLPGLTAMSYSNADAAKREKKGMVPITAYTTDIVYCVVNTAREKPESFFKGFGIIIFDEAHEYQSHTSSRLLWTAQAPCIMGLSATPDERADKMDKMLCPFLGAPLSLESVVPPELIENTNFEGRVREVRYSGHPDHAQDVYNEMKGSVSSIMTIGKIIQDPHRMEMVAAEAELILNLHHTLPADQLPEWGLGPCPLTGKTRRHSLFIFAEHRDYLPALQKILATRLSNIEGLNMIVLHDDDATAPSMTETADIGAAALPSIILRGGVTEDHRNIAKQTRLVLTTYGFSRRGISLPQMTAMILATPRRSGMTQILGRINRLTPDKSLKSIKRIVVDVVDSKISLASQAGERRAAYRVKDWPVYRVKVDHSAYPGAGGEGKDKCSPPPPIGTGTLVSQRKRGEDHDAPAPAGETGARFTLADLQ